jgi:hypothetical protein
LIEVALGIESRDQFLSHALGTYIWDFYDIDGYLRANISRKDKVIVGNVHNMFYINFNYVDIGELSPKFSEIKDQEELLDYLNKQGYTHFLLKRVDDIGQYLSSTGLNISLDANWVQMHFVQIYKNEISNVSLIKISY